MSYLAAILAFLIEIIRLLKRSDLLPALEELQRIRKTIEGLKAAKTKDELQKAAEEISHSLSGGPPSLH